ncbi:hypothetical protein BJ546DRAFT_1070501 [Cryomyces antarcticus]|uniref:Protein YAE1 n=1 Tax=Cryomyces antarcticus TaxID=329879 RepID=A0ABR0LPQ3_9PEZI|nr:Essential protein Yae1, N terminal [Cryomyces antarcticus]KAK5201544.1 Essential protein Yae1, N terminal [Cryomyces antarcticus]
MLRDTPPLHTPGLDFALPLTIPGSPPPNNQLDDIFGSSPSSPAEGVPPTNASTEPSDIPRLRSIHVTAGYRDGIASAKAAAVQAGFDEGFALGAALGLRAGAVLGVLEGCVSGVSGGARNEHGGQDRMEACEEARALLGSAREQLGVGSVMGRDWFDDDGVWMFAVEGADVTFAEVADAHPLVKRWTSVVEALAKRWRVDLDVLGEEEADGEGATTADV